MPIWPPHRMGRLFQDVLYPSLTWARYADAKTVYLTFDDGPVPKLTPFILDELQKRDAKGTFFCVGDNIRKHPEYFLRALAEGHSVGNHTYNHLKGWKTDNATYFENVARCQAQIEALAPKEIVDKKLFRPPYGRIRRSQIKELQRQGYEVVMWDVLSWDFLQTMQPERCLQGTLKSIRGGSIVVFHDNPKATQNMAYALPRVMDALLEKGYELRAM